MGKFTNFNNYLKTKILDDVNSGDEVFYVWVGKNEFWEDNQAPPESFSLEDSELNIRNDMLFGKKITNNEIGLLVNKYDWESNTAYAMYDHRDKELFSKKFYVLNSSNNVYKCLDNNFGNPSTIEPVFISNTAVELADGYKWKYLYTLDSQTSLKFSTSNEIPITPNTDIQTSAVPGSIETIVLENQGENYITFHEGTIQEIVANNMFRIENTASSSNNFYNKSGFYISSGPGSGVVTEIESYFANNSGRYVKTKENITASTSSNYIISPKVTITGDGENATAYSVVNPETYVIDKIKMINSGEQYTIATSTIEANNFYGSGAVSIPIISPISGHGSDLQKELNCEKIVFSMDFDGDEISSIPTDINVGQMGLLISPKNYSNNDIYSEPIFTQIVRFSQNLIASTPFQENEIIIGNTSGAMAKVVSGNTSTTAVTMISGDFVETETVIGQNSSVSGQIFSISSRDIDKYSGEILFYDNIDTLERSEESKETFKLIVKL